MYDFYLELKAIIKLSFLQLNTMISTLKMYMDLII